MYLSKEEFGKLKKRENRVLTHLYEYYKHIVKTYFMIKTFGNDSISDDLLQETFYKFIKAAPRLTSWKQIRFWLMAIAKRTLVDYQRKIFRQKEYNKIIGSRLKQPEDIIEKIHNSQKAVLFQFAFNSLNRKYQEIFKDKYHENLSCREIAVKMNKTERAIRSLLVRIRKRILKEMKKRARSFFREE